METAATEKPTMTPPELRRKLAEAEGRLKAKQTEATDHLTALSADGKEPTNDEWTRADKLTEDQRGLQRIVDGWRQQLVTAEQWQFVETEEERDNTDGAEARNGGRLNRMDPTLPHGDPKNTHNGRLAYSMLRAWRSRIDPNKYKFDGIELEVHQELLKRHTEAKTNRTPEGIMIPLDLPVDRRASRRWASRTGTKTGYMQYEERMRRDYEQERRSGGTFDTTAGGGAIPTILDTTIIELLRARMVTFNLGSRVMTDMQGLFAIPRQSSASTFYMVTQGGSVTATNQTIDQVPFSPHTGGVQTTYTRQLLEQINVDAEMFVREDHAAVVARGVETQAFNGQGNSGYPLGILNNMQVGVYSLGTNGAVPTWTQIVSQEAYPAYFNADVGSLAYVTDALVRGTLKLTVKVIGSTFPIYLWNTEAPDFPVNGYPCAITNLLPQNLTKGSGSNLHTMIFGNWQDLVYALWSGMDTIVDPFTQAANGGVVITTLQDFDVNIRHYQSFANCVDIISSITAPIT
jgi:HK97 family phage major capsid protein